MKITKENGRFESSGCLNECCIEMLEAPSQETKVVEVPTFWRENGKQYKVTSFIVEIPYGRKDQILLRVPRGCFLAHPFTATYYKIEFYD